MVCIKMKVIIIIVYIFLFLCCIKYFKFYYENVCLIFIVCNLCKVFLLLIEK